jgi:hypothetical protein
MTDQPFPDTPEQLLDAADQAIHDNALEAAIGEATRLAAYYTTLRKAGLDTGEAFQLVARFQTVLHHLLYHSVAQNTEQT